MKLSETLYAGVYDLWREAADKTFVREMAKGTLDDSLFRNYMIQDYLYLLDYIETLGCIRQQAQDGELRDFLQSVIAETENETYRVHLPHLKQIGVSDEEVLDAVRYHTTGREDMTLLDEIVYVADAIEENRNYPGLKELQEQAMTDLDGACLFIMDYMLGRLALKGRVPDHDTVAAREFIINRISQNNNTE